MFHRRLTSCPNIPLRIPQAIPQTAESYARTPIPIAPCANCHDTHVQLSTHTHLSIKPSQAAKTEAAKQKNRKASAYISLRTDTAPSRVHVYYNEPPLTTIHSSTRPTDFFPFVRGRRGLLEGDETRVLHVGTATVSDGLVGDACLSVLNLQHSYTTASKGQKRHSKQERAMESSKTINVRELAEVVAGHLGLDFDGGERLAVLYCQYCSESASDPAQIL